MDTYTFNKSNIKPNKGNLTYILIELDGKKFPKSFMLRSPKTGVELRVDYNEGESVDYAASYEFWDGEYDGRLYDGVINGKLIRVELFTTPYSE